MKGKTKKWRMLLAGLLLAAGSLLTGCTEKLHPLQEYDVQYFDYFDTITSFTVYAESEEQFQEYAETFRSELEYYHKLFDIYNSYEGVNNIKTINDNAGIIPVKVDEEIINLLEFAKDQYEATDGRMNGWEACCPSGMITGSMQTIHRQPPGCRIWRSLRRRRSIRIWIRS